ncbi:hypothetical protein ACFL2X_06585 [Candidatus Latescibacterota bacterium]
MRWLEIIELRSTTSNWETMATQIQQMITDLNKDTENKSLTAYSHAMIENDFSIHLTHESCGVEKNGSSLGLHLASVLREYGMVKHSVWIEL